MNADARAVLIVAGAPMLRWSRAGLRELAVPVVPASDVGAMLADLAPAPDEVRWIAGYRSFEICYGSDHRFGVAAFGHPIPTALFVTRLPPAYAGPPASPDEWRPAGAPLPWSRILAKCVRGGGDGVLPSPGSPPLLASAYGLHTFLAPPLTATDLRSMLDEVVQPPELTHVRTGDTDFDVRFGLQEQFRAASFGAYHPSMLLLARLSVDVEPLASYTGEPGGAR